MIDCHIDDDCQMDKKKQLEVWKFRKKIQQILERLCRKTVSVHTQECHMV